MWDTHKPVSKKKKKKHIKKHQNQKKKKQIHTTTENQHTALVAPATPKWLSEDFQSGRNITLLRRNPFQKKEKVTFYSL